MKTYIFNFKRETSEEQLCAEYSITDYNPRKTFTSESEGGEVTIIKVWEKDTGRAVKLDNGENSRLCDLIFLKHEFE